MRYIKWNKDAGDASCRGQYAEVMAHQAEQEKKRQRLDKWTGVIFWTVAVLVWAVGVWRVIRFVRMEYDSVWLNLLGLLYALVFCALTLLVGPILGALAANRLWAKNRKLDKQMTRELQAEGCERIRGFYGFGEPYLVTKCFDSTDRKFRRHDVCLFFSDGAVHLSANLQYPLFDPERDLGCYILGKDEITLTHVPWAGTVATELRVGETVFLLGSRAKEWIEGAI